MKILLWSQTYLPNLGGIETTAQTLAEREFDEVKKRQKREFDYSSYVFYEFLFSQKSFGSYEVQLFQLK